MFKEARSNFSGFGGAAGDGLIVDNAPPEGLSQCLILLDRQPRIVTSQKVLAPGKFALKLRGGSVRSGQVRSLGYIGSFLAEYSAALELRHCKPSDMTNPMRAILEPKVDLPGDFAKRQVNAALVPVNPSQRAAIEGLKYALEKIQGPPGTGKSTTIFHILDARLPAGQRVLVTCSRNVAVESIAQKLEGLQGWPLCVFGPRDRVGGTARRYLLDSQCVCGLVWLLVQTGGLHVQIMVTSKQTSLDRRMILREAIGSCLPHLPKEHDVELLFFLGDLAAASADVQQSLAEEEEKFRDLIFVGGPDADPPVERDVTYVLERPTARGFRLAVGTAWLATHRTDLDFVMYLDDDSYLNVPRLLSLLEEHNSPSLAMGYIMETELDMLDTHICKVCPLNCEACQTDGFLQAFCGKFPEMSLGGCAFLIHQCKLFGQDTAEASLEECVRKAQVNTMQVVHYFGARGAPRWFLGMGWVFGRRIVDFLARNVGDLKKQGAADVQLGFWLAPLEGVYWVDMKDGQFHDYPMPGSTFSKGCTDQTVLVHRMNKERWRDFDPQTCALRCPLTVGGHLDESRRRRGAQAAKERGAALSAAIAAKEAACRGRRGERFLLAFLRQRFGLAYALRDLCLRVERYCAAAADSPEWCSQRAQDSKQATLHEARILLCTIASTSRMLREWEEAMGTELRVHTVIVDECGCTPESSTALLLRLQPANLVLVGDHKQLPPTSLVQPQILEGTGHNRSLLERCVLASGRVHQLREQYRMHPSIGRLVSNLFYSGRLETPRRVAEDRQACERRPLVWMDVQGREEAPNKSYINAAEVNSCLKVVTRLRERIGPKPSVALLTFYKGQLEELMKAVPSDLDVEVLTVDACQGSEFDFVILSTVRANRDLRLGFVKDAQRICVATSRSRLQLFIVGHRQTLCADGDWKQVYEACTAATPEDARPQRPSPAAGFVSVFDALRRAKELDAEQKALQAMEEQSKDPGRRPSRPSSGAESLMWQQASFRNQASQPSIQRRNDGTYQSSTAVAIGGGFRSRRDVYAMEATAKAHLQSLEVPRPAFAAVAPKATDYSQFPELSGRPEASGQKAPMPRCQLRPSTRNDERRARRAAQKASTSEMEVAQPPLSMEATGGTEQVWEDLHEAVLFEMFPEDTPAVEEALLRFAGTPHQAARALEALLARPEAKAMAEGEDDLDYDRASFADEDGPVDWEDEEEWDEDAEDEWEEEEEEWDEYAEEEQVVPTAEVPKPVRRWGSQARQENVFGSLDGAPKWAEMPARPEQGGKELVPLRPKEERGTEDLLESKGRRAELKNPAAARAYAPATCAQSRTERCRELLAGARPALEESIIDYLASMMGECLQDEVDELHETVVEILQGHDMPAKDAENLWQKLKT
ncbi:unnamed protein product [Symbiodinium sp. CCMP2456]|nr:unnamed protein product [Symbiodinium sp. CCMP2456]